MSTILIYVYSPPVPLPSFGALMMVYLRWSGLSDYYIGMYKTCVYTYVACICRVYVYGLSL